MSIDRIKSKLMGIYTKEGKLTYDDLSKLLDELDAVDNELENLKEIVATEFVVIRNEDRD